MRIEITDFSGGIFEAISPADFTERQNATVHGFVLEDEVRLRTQGPIQLISGLTDVIACRTFRGTSQSYVLVLRTGGVLEYAVAPSRTATNTTTAALTFTNLTTIGAEARFTGDARAKVSDEYKPATIVHSLDGTGDGVLVYEDDAGTALLVQTFSDFYPSLTKTVALVTVTNGGSGYTTTPDVTFTGGAGSGTVATARLANQSVVGIAVSEGGTGYTSAPTVGFSGGGGADATAEATLEQIGVTGKLPRHNIACMWGDVLILADIEWSQANAETGLNAGNVKRYSNYAWFATDPTDLTKFDPRFPARIAEEGAVIVGLQETTDGMLVMTTTTTGQAGLMLLRGNAAQYDIEKLRPGLGMLPSIDSTMRSQVHCWWNDVASTMFVDSLGKIYQVRGTQVERIDRYGVVAPETGLATDSVAAIGQWLFACRNGRFLVMRSFGNDGAWTELVKPDGTPSSFSVDRDMLLFVSDAKLYRYCIEGPALERGKINGSYVDLTLATRTLGSPDEVLDKWWTGVSVRIESITDGTLKTVELYDRGALASTPGSALFTLNQAITVRELVSVPGLGPSIEASAKLVLTGDVRIENVSFEVEAGDDQR